MVIGYRSSLRALQRAGTNGQDARYRGLWQNRPGGGTKGTWFSDAVIDESGGTRSDLDTLLHEADFVTLHCKVTPETRGMIGASELSLMKPSAFLVNTARAAIVDYAALYTVLSERRIAGAAIDVFEQEPVRPDDPLLKLDNVVLTPHLAGASWDVPRHHSRTLMQDLSLFAEGRRPKHLANPEVWERRR